MKIINIREFDKGSITVYSSFDESLFLAKEVAGWFGHSNPRMMLQSIDSDEKVVNDI
ncbi:hypothetical protein CPJCM30710_27800 [Clostridium polyendosporum]|uniref:Uncharacterized protein n=1 Tax=Clostridium polyendosporum TaxID=69208 RepID=A0A919S1G3_9CLOT|nr:hypothetical protein CPJCM30710_27800 [Clostridium polyendosporum]